MKMNILLILSAVIDRPLVTPRLAPWLVLPFSYIAFLSHSLILQVSHPSTDTSPTKVVSRRPIRYRHGRNGCDRHL
jgi:hypothetical protein